MTILKSFRHLDAHLARGVGDSTQHIRMANEHGHYQALCGVNFYDWVREGEEDHTCEECVVDMGDFLAEQAKPQKPKYELIDWYTERNVLRAWAHENRN